MKSDTISNLTITEVRHLPIIREYANRIKLVETINQMVPTEMDVDPGLIILGMVLDSLSGRSPLYRLEDFFEEKDTELLLGKPVPAEWFHDYNVGRILDKIFENGPQKIFSQLSQNAIGGFQLNTKGAHYDTTSVTVFGDYDFIDPPLEITYGHSKDKRPDLKQFLVEMLCVDRNIPIFGGTRDGNSSDKTLNNELLSNISSYMAKNGLGDGAYVYVADSAFVTPDNLKKSDEESIRFISRLPATYSECTRVIHEAVEQDNWVDIGPLVQTEPTAKRPATFYKAYDTTVELYDRIYRAIVIHSSAHDKRRHKRLGRLKEQEIKELRKTCKEMSSTPFYCEADAQVAATKMNKIGEKSAYHRITTLIIEEPKYGRGRPKKEDVREPKRYDFSIQFNILEDDDKIEPFQREAGCFVLITNLSSPNEMKEWKAKDLLELYKNQSGIEQNFGFIKDPVYINSVFLKKPKRIEVLGLILLIALLIWRLIERELRLYVQKDGVTLPGWVKRRTKRPTSFMMSTKFPSILVVKIGKQRLLARPLKKIQLEYLKALNVTPDIFISP